MTIKQTINKKIDDHKKRAYELCDYFIDNYKELIFSPKDNTPSEFHNLIKKHNQCDELICSFDNCYKTSSLGFSEINLFCHEHYKIINLLALISHITKEKKDPFTIGRYIGNLIRDGMKEDDIKILFKDNNDLYGEAKEEYEKYHGRIKNAINSKNATIASTKASED